MTTMAKHLHHGPGDREALPWQLHANLNVGGWERAVRLFIGAALFALAFTAGPVWARVVLALLGATGILTSVYAYCPLNRAAGRDSYHRRGILK